MAFKIAIVVGTRPEAIKLIPVYRAFKNHEDFNTDLISTGQHKELLDELFVEFEVAPAHEFKIMTHNQTLSTLSAELHKHCGSLFAKEMYDLVIVQGDTTTSFIAGLEAFYHKIKIAHVEAGLRTSTIHTPFPEEMNRRLIAQIADIHFPPTPQAASNLNAENVNGKISVVGNTVIDSLLYISGKLDKDSRVFNERFKYLDNFEHTVLVTAHRRENFGNGLKNIFAALKRISDQYKNTAFIFPVHPNPRVQEEVSVLKGRANLFLLDPLPYKDLVYIMKRSKIILTDSGGIQEEAPALEVPIIVLREETERQEVIDAGCGVLVGTNQEKIEHWFKQLLTDESIYKSFSKSNNPYGNGMSAQQILEVTLNVLNESSPSHT